MNKQISIGMACMLAFAPMTQAEAQSYNSLRAERAELRANVAQLVKDEWGSVIVLGGCSAAANSDYERHGDLQHAVAGLAACATIGCGFTRSWSNCIKVVSVLFIAAKRMEYLDAQLS